MPATVTRSEPEPKPESSTSVAHSEPKPRPESSPAPGAGASVSARPGSARFWPDGHRRSQVVDLRVDRAPTHARVILDFDVPTGYSLETMRGADGPGWVVTVEATAEARTIQEAGDLIDSVWIEKGSPHTSVHIRAREANLALTEILQTRPPRLVLEVRR
jgi:hypothetical protein